MRALALIIAMILLPTTVSAFTTYTADFGNDEIGGRFKAEDRNGDGILTLDELITHQSRAWTVLEDHGSVYGRYSSSDFASFSVAVHETGGAIRADFSAWVPHSPFEVWNKPHLAGRKYNLDWSISYGRVHDWHDYDVDAATPLPAGIWLLGSAAFVTLALRRRKAGSASA